MVLQGLLSAEYPCDLLNLSVAIWHGSREWGAGREYFHPFKCEKKLLDKLDSVDKKGAAKGKCVRVHCVLPLMRATASFHGGCLLCIYVPLSLFQVTAVHRKVSGRRSCVSIKL